MFEKISLSFLIRPVLAAARPIFSYAKRLTKERNAANGKITQTDLLDVSLEQTLNRLENISTNDVWYRQILQNIGSAYVRPEYLDKPSVLAWLRDPTVRADLKVLARVQLVKSPSDVSSTRSRLDDKYSSNTLEVAQLAVGPIDSIVNILVAGAKSAANEGDLFVAGIMQEGMGQVLTKLEDIGKKAAPSSDEVTIKAHTAESKKELDHITKRRSLPGVDVCAELLKLEGRTSSSGDLFCCSKEMRKNILMWTARALASNKNRPTSQIPYRQKLLKLDPNADTSIIDAWTDAANGDVDQALRGLQARAEGDADARTNIIVILLVYRDSEQALSWFDAQGKIDKNFLTLVGWRNICALLAEKGRWDEAIRYLGELTNEQYELFPDLYFIDGVLNAAQLLPAEIRHYALTMQIFEKVVGTLNGNTTKPFRTRALTAFEKSVSIMQQLGEHRRAAVAEQWRVWLLLTDPETNQQGKDIILAAMLDGAKAVEYMELACAFGIEFDASPFERHLRIRELAGGCPLQKQ